MPASSSRLLPWLIVAFAAPVLIPACRDRSEPSPKLVPAPDSSAPLDAAAPADVPPALPPDSAAATPGDSQAPDAGAIRVASDATVSAPDARRDETTRTPPTPIKLTPHVIETRGLRLRTGSEDAASGSGAQPAFSGDDEVLGLLAAARLTFVLVRDGHWLGAFDLEPAHAGLSLALSTSGSGFALFSDERSGIIAARATATASGEVPPARDAAWLDDETLLLLTDRGLVALDLQGKEKARNDDPELAEATALDDVGDALFARFASSIRAFDRRTLAWSGPALSLIKPGHKLCAAHGRYAALQTASGDLAILDAVSGAIQLLKPMNDYLWELSSGCKDDGLIPLAGRALLLASQCGRNTCWLTAYELARSMQQIAEARDEPRGIALSHDGATLALADHDALHLQPSKASKARRKETWRPYETPRPQPSPDGKFLVGMRARGLVVTDLTTGAEREVALPRIVLEDFGWNPDDPARALTVLWKEHQEYGEVLAFAWLDLARARLGPMTVVKQDGEPLEGDPKYPVEMPGAHIRQVGAKIGIVYEKRAFEIAPGTTSYRVHEGKLAEEVEQDEPKIGCADCPRDTPLVDPQGRWAVFPGDRWEVTPTVVIALDADRKARGPQRVFEPHLGPLHDAFVTSDGSLVTVGHGALAVWDMAAWLAAQ